MATPLDPKHRDESEAFFVDFANRLGSGESLSSVTAVRVHDPAGNDVSAQFGSPTGSISGTKVQFTLADAQGPSDQTLDLYLLYVEVLTSDSEKLVETPALHVIRTASVT